MHFIQATFGGNVNCKLQDWIQKSIIFLSWWVLAKCSTKLRVMLSVPALLGSKVSFLNRGPLFSAVRWLSTWKNWALFKSLSVWWSLYLCLAELIISESRNLKMTFYRVLIIVLVLILQCATRPWISFHCSNCIHSPCQFKTAGLKHCREAFDITKHFTKGIQKLYEL